MDNKTIDLLLTVASFLLAAVSIIMLFVVLFSKDRSLGRIIAILVCTSLSNVFGILRNKLNKKDEEEK